MASDVRDHLAVLDERRSRRSEKAFGNLEASRRVLAPEARTGCERHGVELSFSAECVNDAVCDNRHGTRPFVEAEVVAVRSRIAVDPLLGAGPGVERLNDLAIADAMKQDEAAVNHDRPAESLSDRLRPHDLRATWSPVVSEGRPPVDAVALRPKVLRPVRSDRLRAEPECDKAWKHSERCRSHH